jgi:hypothetical protein
MMRLRRDAFMLVESVAQSSDVSCFLALAQNAHAKHNRQGDEHTENDIVCRRVYGLEQKG